MGLFFRAIADAKDLSLIKDSWNAFVNEYGDNPFTFYEFMQMFLSLNRLQGWSPLVLIGYDKDGIAGIAPLTTKDLYGIRVVSFVLKPYFTPDFVVKDRLRDEFISDLLSFVFHTMKCKVADLTFPSESPNLGILERISSDQGFSCGTEPYIGRRTVVVPSSATWEQFQNLRGNSFWKRFRRIEGKLNRVGSWKISYVQTEAGESETLEKMLAIDKASWKQEWRTQKGIENDPELPIVWDGAGLVAKIMPDFTRMVCFLEVDDHPVAFCIFVRYKKTGFIVKTSFDARYKNYSPGLIVWNAAVRALFEGKMVREIDFQTDMSFMNIWTPLSQGRTRLMLAKGVFPVVALSIYRNSRLRNLVNDVLRSR